MKKHESQVQTVRSEVQHMLNKNCSVFGPRYDQLNAKLRSRGDKVANLEVMDPELNEFRL